MKNSLLICLWILLNASLAFSYSEDSFEIDIPEGYELCDIEEEGIEECDDSLFHSVVNFSHRSHEPEPTVNAAMATLGSGPSAVVANCVNAITGDFFDSQVDLYVPGPVPFVVQRSYCSSGHEWHFQHIPILQVVPSKGNHHLSAGYQDDNGSGMLYRTRLSNSSSDGIRGALKVPENVFKKGLTNCGSGEISGQTNWQNSTLFFIRRNEEKYYLLRHGSHAERIFGLEKRIGKRHRKGAPTGKFRLEKEFHPDGNRLHYTYRKDDLRIVEAVGSSGNSLGVLNVENTPNTTKWSLGKTSVSYAYDGKKKMLLHAIPSHGINVSYSYDIKGRLKRKNEPDNRFLCIEYDDENEGRVKSLKGPLGANNALISTHQFSYPKKGITDVRDALHHLTRYRYDKETQRLQAILRFDEGDKLYSKDQFYWDETNHIGNLLARTFEGDGIIYFCRLLDYDTFGNVVKDSLYGNLTGTSKVCLRAREGQPLNADQGYAKLFRYSRDGWNLLLEENDGRKQIECTYYPNTNLLQSRLTKSGHAILKREFFSYQDGAVVKEIWDNGNAIEENNLSGVTERHRKLTTLTTKAPIGLPEIIEEQYWNKNTNQYALFKKTVKHYTEQGKVCKEELYGSEGKLAQTVQFAYDRLGNVIEKIDALGNKTTYKYDENGNKLEEEGPLPGFHKIFKYDHANRLIEERETWQDGTCLTTTHSYNALSQRIATTDIHGNETTYAYDAQGRLVMTKRPPLITAHGILFPEDKTFYNAMGNAIEKWDSNGFCTKREYTIRGKESRIAHPDGSMEQKIYSVDGLLVCEISKTGLQTHYHHDPFGRVIRTEIKNAQGNLLKTTSATYNTFHLLTETDEEGILTVYDYDGAGRKVSKKRGDRFTKYIYDSLGRITKTIDSIDHASDRVTVQIFDPLDRVIEERIEDAQGNVFKQEQYRCDAIGNRTHVIAFTQAGKSETVTIYNPHGKPVSITDALGNTTRFTYDYAYVHEGVCGLKVTRIDPLGNQEITIHDPHGNIACHQYCNASGDVTRSASHTYDPAGHKTATRTFVYNSLDDRKVIETEWQYDPMGNVTCCVEAKGTPEQKTTRYHYNVYGEKEKTELPNGITLTHSYDVLGRLAAYFSSDNTIHYTYRYDSKDRVTKVHDHIHGTTTKRTYNANGNLEKEMLDNGCILYYGYDQLDRPINITLPDNSSAHYHYNAQYLTSVERVKNNAAYTHCYNAYDLSGNVLSETLIGQSGTLSYQYDLLQRTIRFDAPYWKEAIPQDGYDQSGNLLKREVHDPQGNLTYRYAYDDLYQLISEEGLVSHTYQNDSLCNRVSKNNEPYTLNSLNQLLTQADCTYHYDTNGNLKEKTKGNITVNYTYDALDRLISVDDGSNTTTYTYDSFHRRTSKTSNGVKTLYLYQGQNEIGAMIDNTITQLRILGITHGAEIGAAIALELNGIAYAPIHDPYGNLVALVDTSGNLSESYRYTAFGEMEVFSSTPLDNPWRYSSKRFDPETGFLYFGHRYYDPEIGRWTTPDPAGFTDGPNLYSYAHNHPLAYIDPDGRFVWLLAPIAISLTAEYCLPAAVMCLEPYVCAEVGGFLTGLVNGFNINFFESAAAETLGYHNLGMAIGASLNLLPGKNVSNVISKGGSLISNVATKELSAIATNTIATKSSKWFSWFKPSAPINQATHKTSQVADKHLAQAGLGEITKKASRHRFVPDANATGSHTVFKKDSITGKISKYETYKRQTNLKNPNPWESMKRYDGYQINEFHFNKVLQKQIRTPHVHDPLTPGGIRPAELWEMPR